jgi:hypothetical protein
LQESKDQKEEAVSKKVKGSGFVAFWQTHGVQGDGSPSMD